MSRRARSLGVLLVVPALAVAGCGGKSDADQIKALVGNVAKDSTYACSHATANALKDLGGSEAACKKGLTGAERGYVKGAINVSVSGSSATADFTSAHGKRHVTFVKQGGGWKIDTIKAG